jgi:hypothetical protein
MKSRDALADVCIERKGVGKEASIHQGRYEEAEEMYRQTLRLREGC